MNINEIKGNIFDIQNTHYVHCISGDFALGAGIAKQFEQRFAIKKQLFNTYQNGINQFGCIKTGNIFNLVTKNKYWQKPTYQTLSTSLKGLKMAINKYNIKSIAMPAIGCGLDKLEWNKVKSIITKVFQDTEIDITVVFLK